MDLADVLVELNLCDKVRIGAHPTLEPHPVQRKLARVVLVKVVDNLADVLVVETLGADEAGEALEAGRPRDIGRNVLRINVVSIRDMHDCLKVQQEHLDIQPFISKLTSLFR